MTLGCAGCGTELQHDVRFCSQCGSPVAASAAAEYKQVAVLFADVVHSMGLAAAVGAERLREIMAGLFGRCGVLRGTFDDDDGVTVNDDEVLAVRGQREVVVGEVARSWPC